MTEGDNSHTITYAYDSQDQLIRENNEDENYTHTWTYNAGGNITQRNRYSYTSGEQLGEVSTPAVAYTYDNENWGDLLTGYGTKTVTYDQIGNPETFGARAYTWEHGRQLKSLTEGTTTWNYTYDADGMRTGRTDGTTANTYTYIYTGSQLTQMKKGGTTFSFTYDANGVPLTFSYGNSTYYYATNLQGDVVALLRKTTTGMAVVGFYIYDAWGNCTISGNTSVLMFNPLRYRGYVYDQETGLYYLQSRYYDPEVGRFLNADGFTTTGQGFTGNNMFAYCGNNAACFFATETSWTTSKELCNSQQQSSANDSNGCIRYDVPLYNQGSYSLCWAFCQVMIEDFHAGITRTNAQATERAIAISKSVNGENWNRGGWPTNNIDKYGNPVFEEGINSLNDLYDALVEHGPMYGYYWKGSGNRAHLIVITGVDLNRGIVYTNNPWGFAGEQTYSEFLAGVAWYYPDSGMPFHSYMYVN